MNKKFTAKGQRLRKEHHVDLHGFFAERAFLTELLCRQCREANLGARAKGVCMARPADAKTLRVRLTSVGRLLCY